MLFVFSTFSKQVTFSLFLYPPFFLMFLVSFFPHVLLFISLFFPVCNFTQNSSNKFVLTILPFLSTKNIVSYVSFLFVFCNFKTTVSPYFYFRYFWFKKTPCSNYLVYLAHSYPFFLVSLSPFFDSLHVSSPQI